MKCELGGNQEAPSERPERAGIFLAGQTGKAPPHERPSSTDPIATHDNQQASAQDPEGRLRLRLKPSVRAAANENNHKSRRWLLVVI